MVSAWIFALGMKKLCLSVRDYDRGHEYEAGFGGITTGLMVAILGAIGTIRYFRFVITEDWNYAESMTHPGISDIGYFIAMAVAFVGIVVGIVFGVAAIRSYSRKGALQKIR